MVGKGLARGVKAPLDTGDLVAAGTTDMEIGRGLGTGNDSRISWDEVGRFARTTGSTRSVEGVEGSVLDVSLPLSLCALSPLSEDSIDSVLSL